MAGMKDLYIKLKAGHEAKVLLLVVELKRLADDNQSKG